MKKLIVLALVAGCADEGPRLSMKYSRLTLYDAPFPSDDLRKDDGTIDVSLLPNPNHVDLIEQGRTLLARDAHGFSLAAGVYFRSAAPIDPKTLPDLAGSMKPDASVYLLGVDPNAPDYLQKRPIDVAFLADGGPFGSPNMLALVPLQGVPMRANERYAAVVTSRVHDTKGHPLVRAAELDDLLAQRPPAQMGMTAFNEYHDALNAITEKEMVALTVFTTDDPTIAVAKVRDDALANHAVLAPSPSPSPSAVYDDYCVFNAKIDVPVYQSGTPPYSTSADGGDWLFDANGNPIFDHTETANVQITIPRAATPTGGWPLLLFVRTGGGGDVPLVERGKSAGGTFTGAVVPGTGPAMDLARVGWAGIEMEGPLGGSRNTTNGNEDSLVFNVFNAAALRDNIRQQAMELILFTRVLPQIAFDASTCPGAGNVTVDGAHLVLMGHSMGSWIAPLTLAFEPSLGATIWSGAGGSYIANVMDKIQPLHVRPLAEAMLDYDMDGRSLVWHDPALMIVQWAAEPSDPQVYDSLINAHVLMEQGIVDHYILPSIANSTSLALGLDEAGPAYDATNAEEQMLMQPALAPLLPLIGRKTLTLPVSANHGAYTAVVIQHNGDGIEDGHEVIFQTEAPKHQYRCFLQSFAKGTPLVPPDGAENDPCP